MWDLFVFAVIGLLAGAASLLCYRDRSLLRVLGAMLLGMIGALVGGLISRPIWPAIDGELFSGALLMSLLGALLLLILWPWIAHARAHRPGS